jgi:hypothetical protein
MNTVPTFGDLLLAFPGESGDIADRRKPARALRDDAF